MIYLCTTRFRTNIGNYNYFHFATTKNAKQTRKTLKHAPRATNLPSWLTDLALYFLFFSLFKWALLRSFSNKRFINWCLRGTYNMMMLMMTDHDRAMISKLSRRGGSHTRFLFIHGLWMHHARVGELVKCRDAPTPQQRRRLVCFFEPRLVCEVNARDSKSRIMTGCVDTRRSIVANVLTIWEFATVMKFY